MTGLGQQLSDHPTWICQITKSYTIPAFFSTPVLYWNGLVLCFSLHFLLQMIPFQPAGREAARSPFLFGKLLIHQLSISTNPPAGSTASIPLNSPNSFPRKKREPGTKLCFSYYSVHLRHKYWDNGVYSVSFEAFLAS